MGEMEVPADALYGASTQRAVLNFPISGQRFPRRFIQALALVKLAAAETNAELVADPKVTEFVTTRTALGRWGRPEEIGGIVAVVLGVDAATGEHPSATVELQLRRSLPEQHLEAAVTVPEQHDRRGGRRFDAGRFGAAGAPLFNPAVRQRGRLSRDGRATPSCRTSRPTSSGPRR